ncbi:MAG: enolase [Rhodobacteraceae bacterium]|nr:enolase [Paracoccaceae bacterium]
MNEIQLVHGRRIWDSRGRPTVEVEVTLANGIQGRSAAPAGASRGMREAVDLRDGGSRVAGMDVRKAIANVNGPIARELVGRPVGPQRRIDDALIRLDGTANKSNLGGNAMVATSQAVLNAAAANESKPLWVHLVDTCGQTPSIPLPEIQIFGGGAHAGRRIDVQDFMIMVPGAESLGEALLTTSEIYLAAGTIMERRHGSAGVADEGGWWPQFASNEEALEVLVSAIEAVGEIPGDRVVISLDVAASEFGSNGMYTLALEDRVVGTEELINLLGSWIESYPIVSIEDPLAEDDLEGMKEFTKLYGSRIQVIGDDLLATNAALVADAAQSGACNGTLIKVNQAGTVSEAIDAFGAARQAGFATIVSARSGETEEVTICHLAVGLGAGQLKVGSFSRSERMAKWNECLRIGEHPAAGSFAGGRSLSATWWQG